MIATISMDKLFSTLMGSYSNPSKTITIIAENFSLLEDQARFLKASLAIPAIKKLALDRFSKRLIQIGPLQHELADQVRRLKWDLNQYEDFGESICTRMEEDLSCLPGRSLIFINDVSRLELASSDPNETYKLLKLIEKLKNDKTKGQHFIVLFYQCSTPLSSNSLLRDIEYMSQAVVRVKSCKAGYFKSIWWQDVIEPDSKFERSPSLIRPKVINFYCTCKIGKSYWSDDLLCFYDRKQVPKNYNLDNDTYLNEASDGEDSDDVDIEEKLPHKTSKLNIEQPNITNRILHPYAQAQNPEHSRIFYYPDKDDDIDEDDPDNDLGI